MFQLNAAVNAIHGGVAEHLIVVNETDAVLDETAALVIQQAVFIKSPGALHQHRFTKIFAKNPATSRHGI